MVIQPWKTIFILCLSILLSFTTSIIRSRLTNREQLNSWRREIADWNEAFREARRAGNKRVLAKVQKQQSRIMSLQGEMMRQSMRVSLIFIVPFLLVWLGLTGRILSWQLFETPFSGGEAIALLPWFGENPLELGLVLWYLICSFASGALFTQVFGLGTEVVE